MTEVAKRRNLTWHHPEITREDRERRNGHKGCVVWFTGLSGSGKSTLAHAVEEVLFERGCHVYVLDGDNVRHGLNKDLGFSPADRVENIRRIGEVAKLFMQAGFIAMTAFISPYRDDRRIVRSLVDDSFLEVYVKCDLDVCEGRDPKGLYKKARNGEIKEFTGISAPYEEPANPELIVDTVRETLEETTQNVLNLLETRGVLS